MRKKYKPENKKTIFHFLLAYGMSFSLSYGLIATMNFRAEGALILTVGALCLLSCSLLFYNGLTTKITWGAFTGIGLVGVFFFNLHKSSYVEEIKAFFLWLYEFNMGLAPFEPRYEPWAMIVVTAGVTCLTYLFTVQYFHFIMVLFLGAALFVSQILGGFTQSDLSFYTFLFCITLYYLQHIYSSHMEKETNQYAKPILFALYTVPITAMIFVISLAVPGKAEPMEWEWLDTRINAISTRIENIYYGESGIGDGSLSVASTGFGTEETYLGRELSLSNMLVLRVESPRSMYLRGAIKDFYTGTAWQTTQDTTAFLLGPGLSEEYDLRSWDIQEMQDGIALLKEEEQQVADFYHKDQVRITFENLSTRYIFAPLYAEKIYLGESMEVYNDFQGILSAGYSLEKGFDYSLDVYSLKYADPTFQEMLRKSKSGLYRETFEAQYGNYSPNAGTFRDADQQKLFDRIQLAEHYQRYFRQLPEELPKRVIQLAQELADPFDNDYDKVKAIEKYLAKHHMYTLSPEEFDGRGDFVDHFLFESQEGYCTYYASAMTVLTRSLGIPARYVEGYMLPQQTVTHYEEWDYMGRFQEIGPQQNTFYRVTNQNAHAWVEVYFEGFGWLAFEPTSPFEDSFNTPEATPISPRAPSEPEIMEPQPAPENIIENSSRALPFDPLSVWMVLLAVMGLAGIMGFHRLKHQWMLRKIDSLSPRESVLQLYQYYIKVLQHQGAVLEEGETPMQYGVRVNQSLDLIFDEVDFTAVTEIFMKARYSTLEVTEQDREKIYQFYELLLPQAKMNMGSYQYFTRMYILGSLCI